jgi:hypothetical protein
MPFAKYLARKSPIKELLNLLEEIVLIREGTKRSMASCAGAIRG